MKAAVGFGFFLLFLAGLALVMLQGQERARHNIGSGGAAITGIHWQPSIVNEQPVPSADGLFVQFTADGAINGSGGCNTFTGHLESVEQGIAVGELATTRKACEPAVMALERDFLAALRAAARFEAAPIRLRLFDARGEMLVELWDRDRD